MAEARTPDVVRREIGAERQQLAGALDRLRLETAEVKRRLWRRTKRGASLVLVVAGVATAAVLAVKRVRR